MFFLRRGGGVLHGLIFQDLYTHSARDVSILCHLHPQLLKPDRPRDREAATGRDHQADGGSSCHRALKGGGGSWGVGI